MTKSTQLCNPKNDYALGAIVRIKLENFVTYDSLEFSPGSNLNVLIGPNGTGKSSIVCAICLGMAGKPSVLGRAAAICDYIKTGHKKARIEIELNNTKGTNHTITRDLHNDNRSNWWLNGREVKLKEVEELVNRLNIQVGNLCQFLPQEKVSEFARMNPYEILENTEKAVGGLELYEQHIELKEKTKNSREDESKIKKIEEELKMEQAKNSRLEIQVSSYQEKKKHEENVLWLKRKRACLMYTKKRKEYELIKKERGQIEMDLQEINSLLKPKEDRKLKIESKLRNHKKILDTKSNQIRDYMTSTRGLSNQFNESNDKAMEIKQDFHIKETEVKQRKVKLKNLGGEVENIREQWERSKLELPNIDETENKIKERNLKSEEERAGISEKRFEVSNEIEQKKAELTSLNQNLTKLQSFREEKLNKLKTSQYNHAYKAIEWLEKNRGRFRGEVYEPMFLSINVKNSAAARYIEANIPNRDLCQLFLFEYSEDVHLFMSEVRNKLQLIVHSAVVPKKTSQDFRPPRPISEIKKFGFNSFLRDVIEAPEAILGYLCLYYSIHSIPIGNQQTQNKLQEILPHIRDFQRIYTATHCYSINKSRYSDKISSSSNEVGPSYWLTSSIDSSQVNQLKNRCQESKNRISELQNEVDQYDNRKQQLTKDIDASRAEQGKQRERRQYITNLHKKLQYQLKKFQELKDESNDLFIDAETKAKFLSELAIKRGKIYAEYVKNAQTIVGLNKDQLLAVYQETQYQSERRKLENELLEDSSRRQEKEEMLAECVEKIKWAKDAAKNALDNASKTNDINFELGVPEGHKAIFNELPDTLEEIDHKMHEYEALSSMSTDVDDGVVEEFKQREIRIERLTKDYEKKQNNLENQKATYEELKNDWHDKVEKMVQDINLKFTALFRQMKCQGEIALSIPDNPDDFAKYGVKIMVSFRNDEAMQELTAWQQSGGEKSVATMLYMISMQEMTRCPFRVVDEINQGMDPINERKVFDIITQNSCDKLFAQYFLLTPKLLPDLEFDEKTNVICVFNGPKNLPHDKYDLNRFIKLRKQIQENEEKSVE